MQVPEKICNVGNQMDSQHPRLSSVILGRGHADLEDKLLVKGEHSLQHETPQGIGQLQSMLRA